MDSPSGIKPARVPVCPARETRRAAVKNGNHPQSQTGSGPAPAVTRHDEGLKIKRLTCSAPSPRVFPGGAGSLRDSPEFSMT
jgi:hypothetical protein